MILTLVANTAPVIETVAIGNIGNFMIERVAIAEPRLVASVNFHTATLAGGDAFAFPYRHESGIAVRIDIKAIIA
jgi:hypothetical protein